MPAMHFSNAYCLITARVRYELSETQQCRTTSVVLFLDQKITRIRGQQSRPSEVYPDSSIYNLMHAKGRGMESVWSRERGISRRRTSNRSLLVAKEWWDYLVQFSSNLLKSRGGQEQCSRKYGDSCKYMTRTRVETLCASHNLLLSCRLQEFCSHLPHGQICCSMLFL